MKTKPSSRAFALAAAVLLSHTASAQVSELSDNLLDGLQSWSGNLLEVSNLLQPLASPNVQGNSSETKNVVVGKSTLPGLISPKNSGLSMVKPNGSWSSFIDIFEGPITQVIKNATANQAGPFFAPPPSFFWYLDDVAQVWYNNQNTGANVYSLRQLNTSLPTIIPALPRFGGVVIGQVKSPNNIAYAVGSGVYFGEWSPAPSQQSDAPSTNLNMTSSERTVWYVGDNAVTSMPTLVNAQYNVVGIRQTGVNGNLPHAPNLYKGTLTANYGGGSGSLTGAITRGSDSVNFAGTSINANGTFNNGSTIEGRFYNNAQALAGIYTGGGASSHVAFGGSKTN